MPNFSAYSGISSACPSLARIGVKKKSTRECCSPASLKFGKTFLKETMSLGSFSSLCFADEIVSDRPVNPQVNFGINQTGKNVLSADINHLLTVRQDGVFTDGDKLSVFYCNPAFDNPL